MVFEVFFHKKFSVVTLNTELKNLLSGFDFFVGHYFEGAVKPNTKLLTGCNIRDNQRNFFKHRSLSLKPVQHAHPKPFSLYLNMRIWLSP